MILQDRLIKAELRNELLQSGILLGELLQLSDLFRLEIAILLLPAMEGLFRDPDLPDQVGHGHPHLRLLQNRNKLFGRKPLLLHSRSPLFLDGKSAKKLTSNPDHFARGTSHITSAQKGYRFLFV